MDQPKIERMLRLMRMMASNTNYTVDELAEILGTTYRSIYRYIETFKDCGFVVNKVRRNVYKLEKMPKGYVELAKLIYFSEEEAYIVNSLIQGLSGSNALKANLHKKLSAIYNCTSIAEYTDSQRAAVNIEMLGKAVREKKKVILKGYESANSKTISDRLIEPFEFSTNYVDIWGYDIEHNENKVFKISRASNVVVLEDSWTHEEDHKRSYTDIFRMSGYEEMPVKLLMSNMAKNILTEEYPLAVQYLKKYHDEWILDTTVCSLEGVGRFCIGLADQIKVMEGKELIGYIRDFSKNYLNNY